MGLHYRTAALAAATRQTATLQAHREDIPFVESIYEQKQAAVAASQ